MAAEARPATDVEIVDLAVTPLRELNQRLHEVAREGGPTHWRIVHPNGAHAVAVLHQVPDVVAVWQAGGRAVSVGNLLGPTIVGTGFEWVDELQNEHGIWIDGGEDISIERPTISDTPGLAMPAFSNAISDKVWPRCLS